MNDYRKIIIRTIDNEIKKYKKKDQYDQTLRGKITGVNSNLYTVSINDVSYTIKAKGNDTTTYSVNDLVLCRIPMCKWSDMYIDGKIPM